MPHRIPGASQQDTTSIPVELLVRTDLSRVLDPASWIREGDAWHHRVVPFVIRTRRRAGREEGVLLYEVCDQERCIAVETSLEQAVRAALGRLVLRL